MGRIKKATQCVPPFQGCWGLGPVPCINKSGLSGSWGSVSQSQAPFFMHTLTVLGAQRVTPQELQGGLYATDAVLVFRVEESSAWICCVQGFFTIGLDLGECVSLTFYVISCQDQKSELLGRFPGSATDLFCNTGESISL